MQKDEFLFDNYPFCWSCGYFVVKDKAAQCAKSVEGVIDVVKCGEYESQL